MNTESAINLHIRRYINENGLTIVGLERLVGCGRTSINGILNGKNNMGRDLFERADSVLRFTPECWAELHENESARKPIDTALRATHANPINEPYPWPLTVAELKANPPVYNWSVM